MRGKAPTRQGHRGVQLPIPATPWHLSHHADKATVVLSSRRSTCPLTAGLLPLAARCDPSLAEPMAVCFPAEQDEKAQPLFSVCSFLSLLGKYQQVSNTRHLFTNKENPHFSAFISLLIFCGCFFVVVLIPVSNKALTQLNKALQSLAQLTLATGRSIAFLYLSALLGREKGPLLSQPRHLHKASVCCEPGPLTGRAERR